MLRLKGPTFADNRVCTSPEVGPEVPDTGEPHPGQQQEACIEQCKGQAWVSAMLKRGFAPVLAKVACLACTMLWLASWSSFSACLVRQPAEGLILLAELLGF